MEVDESGEHVAIVAYDQGDVDAAYAELDARYETGEGAGNLAVAMRRPRREAQDARDWERLSTFYAPEFERRDHRMVGFGIERGQDVYVRTFRHLTEIAPDVRQRSNHERAAARGMLSHITQSGTRDGGQFELDVLAVQEIDAAGRTLRIDLYEPEKLPLSLARFGELKERDRR